jgi:hypothetical protein
MPKVRSGGGEKWSRRSSAASPDYKAGVESPRAPWQAATAAAAAQWAAGVQAAVSKGTFAKGVVSAGDAKWARGAAGKGVGRYAEGVSGARPDYESAVAPYLQTIESTALPARGPKGSAQNIQRVAVLAGALHARKVAS